MKKTTMFHRVMVMFLAVTLMLTSGSILAFADDTSPELFYENATFTFDGDYSYNAQSLYLITDITETEYGTTWKNYYPYNAESGVFVNGEKVVIEQFAFAWNKEAYLKVSSPVEVNDIVTIKGIFTSSELSKSFSAQEYSVMWNGTTWEKAPDIQDVVIGPGITDKIVSDGGFYTSLSDANILSKSDWSCGYRPTNDNSGIFVNDVKQESASIVATSANKCYITTKVKTLQAGDIITVKGCFEYSSSTGISCKFSVQTATIMFDGTNFKTLSSGVKYNNVEVQFDSAYSFNNQKMYLKCSNRQLTASWDFNYKPIADDAESGIFINDVRRADVGIICAWNGELYFDLGSGLSENGIITIKGSFYSSNASLSLDSFSVVPVSYVYNGTSYETVCNSTDVVLSDSDITPLEKGFYVNCSDTAIPCGWGTTEYRACNDDSGIYLNGEKVSNGYMVGDRGGHLYVSVGTQPANGDVAFIKGKFENVASGEYYKFSVRDYYAKFNGERWNTFDPNETFAAGDLNKDKAIDIRDLIHGKKLFAGGQQQEISELFDLDGNGTVTTADIVLLRKYLLGIVGIEDMPRYSTASKIEIFADVPDNPNNAEKYFAAGFTSMILSEDYTSLRNSDNNLNTTYQTYVAKIANKGNIILRNHANSSTYWNGLEDSLNLLPNVIGYYQTDEPVSADFTQLSNLVNWHNANAADKLFHVNLLPSYATCFDNSNTYSDYITNYINTVLSNVNSPKTLSVDNYPLINNKKLFGLLDENVIRDSYLSNLLIISNAAKELNKTSVNKTTVSFCIQDFVDGNVRDITSQADIDFQVNTALAAGAKQLEYFAYCSTSDGSITGMIGSDGSVTSKYNYAKKSNLELNNWSHVLKHFDWQGVYTVSKSGSTVLSNASGNTLSNLPGAVVGADKDTVVGYFVDEANRNGYMITNFTEPSKNQTDNVTVNFGSYEKALVFQNGEGHTVNLDNGSYQFELTAGAGVFAIPY